MIAHSSGSEETSPARNIGEKMDIRADPEPTARDDLLDLRQASLIAIRKKMSAVNEQELTDLFARLGARNPDQWARSQINEGIPQLARFLFLRQAGNVLSPQAIRHGSDESCR